ncbi:MAG TPA: calcium-binding protein, partial [Sphingomicrobium sp.]|nr:calcium-binding protein [Sphingomicrobium sp.]
MAIIDGTNGNDILIGTPGDDTINGLAGNDILRGRAGNDVLNGDDDHDFLVGGDDNDALNGGSGDDYLRGGEGDDTIDGGAGWDRAAFTVLTNNPAIGETGVQSGATVDLNIQGIAQNTGHGMDTLIGIEHVSGTAYDDTLIGNGGDNWIWGEGGNDTLLGGGGNDLITVDAGNSTLDGGTGTDTASFWGIDTFPVGVTVSLALQGGAQIVAAGSTMTLTGFENLSGTTYGDTLIGDAADNILAGYTGDDILFGGAGNDILYGDGSIQVDTHGTGGSGPITTYADAAAAFGLTAGNDILDGGAGDDVLNGGGGIDTASFASWTERVIASLGPT